MTVYSLTIQGADKEELDRKFSEVDVRTIEQAMADTGTPKLSAAEHDLTVIKSEIEAIADYLSKVRPTGWRVPVYRLSLKFKLHELEQQLKAIQAHQHTEDNG